MVRKTVIILAFLLIFAGIPAKATDMALPSDILVTLRDGDTVVDSGSVELCRAGDLQEDGFLLAQEFGGGFIPMDQIPSPDFAFWMSRKAKSGILLEVGQAGVVRYPAMEPGLYLVRQHRAPEGYYAFRPYLVAVTGDMTLVDTYPVLEKLEPNPGTSESTQPYLAALGVAVTLAGFIFWDEARRRELQDCGGREL